MGKENKSLYESKILDGPTYSAMIKSAAAMLAHNCDEVNDLNVFPVPDGDTGDNMSMTITGGARGSEKAKSSKLADVSSAVSKGMLLGARGNSGVIVSQFFAGIARGFEDLSEAVIEDINGALVLGVKQAYAAVMNPTEGTILTVIREGVAGAQKKITDEATIGSLFEDILHEMEASLEHTPELLPILKEAGVVDSGGKGIIYIFKGIVASINGEKIEEVQRSSPVSAQDIDFSSFGPDSVMTYGYCTELLLQLLNSKINIDQFRLEEISSFLGTIGDSIVIYQTGTIVKLHVHTLTPDRVLEFCRNYGEFLTVKIENMSVQHNETIGNGQGEDHTSAGKSANLPKGHSRYGIVAVSSGEGFSELFRELGADYIVDGGQTNNPSTRDFIKAFDYTNADHIFVFPNNSNIILAAQQAASIYKESEVHVIHTKDLGAGYVALSTFDPEAEDPDAMSESFKETLESVSTGFISTSVRDTELNGVEIKEGDYIGFLRKEMVASDRDIKSAIRSLLEKLIDDDVYMLTVFTGQDASEETTEDTKKFIKENFPSVEYYITKGGQAVYPYIFTAEK